MRTNILISTIYKKQVSGFPMVTIHPFAAVRPRSDIAQSVAAVPYDVVDAEEARVCIEANPLSFLRVSRADAEIPSISPHDPRVYEQAKANFHSLLERHLLQKDDVPSLYIYRVHSGERTFTGLVACMTAEEYRSGLIRKHELTTYEKEEDRTRHIDAVNAQTGLVFLVYRDKEDLHQSVEALVYSTPPECEVINRNGTRHQVYRIRDPSTIHRLQSQFSGVDALYIADGHHRAAAAVNVALAREQEGRSTPESSQFMAVLFAHHQVMIHGYSRLVRDLNDLSIPAFLQRLKEQYPVEPCNTTTDLYTGKRSRSIFMYLPGQWYEIRLPNQGMVHPDTLDVAVLQKHILGSLLGIGDPRKDIRLQYMGGVHSREELERLVDRGSYAVAFVMMPVTIETVMEIADENGIMPPKSTWFEPKLLSGLVIHTLD
jgi:uncharacterized protein (DUF1015 family)